MFTILYHAVYNLPLDDDNILSHLNADVITTLPGRIAMGGFNWVCDIPDTEERKKKESKEVEIVSMKNQKTEKIHNNL